MRKLLLALYFSLIVCRKSLNSFILIIFITQQIRKTIVRVNLYLTYGTENSFRALATRWLALGSQCVNLRRDSNFRRIQTFICVMDPAVKSNATTCGWSILQINSSSKRRNSGVEFREASFSRIRSPTRAIELFDSFDRIVSVIAISLDGLRPEGSMTACTKPFALRRSTSEWIM